MGLTTDPDCPWTAAPSQAWITVGTPGGSGSATLAYSVGANASTSSRTGTLAVGGQTFTVSQEGAGPTCTYRVSPIAINLPADGGNGSIDITADSWCTWTVVSSQGWLTPAILGGTGSAKVPFTAKPNKRTTDKRAMLTVVTEAVTVTLGSKSKPGRPK